MPVFFFIIVVFVLHHPTSHRFPLSVPVLFILKCSLHLCPLILSLALFPIQYGGAVCYCDNPTPSPFFAVSGVIDKCAWLCPLPDYSSFARHFVTSNQSLIGSGAAGEWQWSGKCVGYSYLSSWFIRLSRSLAPISRSDEDLTARVDLACSIWAFGMI